MKTYQDLIRVGQSDEAKGNFCRTAVNVFMGTTDYKNAKDGEAYYNKHNLTIETFQKFLYTLSGRKIEDNFSVNYKLKTLFFRRLIIQQVQYVLGNGVTLQKNGNKEKLGKDFDFQIQTAAKRALASGKAFGFWNMDHLEVFGYADTPAQPGFCPLYDEYTGELKAGVRYWFRRVDNDMIFRATLYEEDGYTEYTERNEDEVQLLAPKRAYKVKVATTKADGSINIGDENYTRLPIVPLYSNDSHESELVGIRECIDCYDYIKSGLANDIDEATGFYWVLQNTAGMDDSDLARFVQRMKTVKAAVVDTDSGSSVEAHTIDVPVDARRTMLELLRKDIYEDFQALDINTLSAAAKTTQEIQAAYQAQDNKCADFEYYILDFIGKILNLAEINDTPTLNWNRVINQQEQTQTVLMAANYLPEDIIIKHLPFLTPEEAEIAIKEKSKAEMNRFGADDEEENEEESEEESEEETKEKQKTE